MTIAITSRIQLLAGELAIGHHTSWSLSDTFKYQMFFFKKMFY